MRETMKDLIKSTITGIGIALTVFCVTGMVFDIAYDGNFSLDNYQFSKTTSSSLSSNSLSSSYQKMIRR